MILLSAKAVGKLKDLNIVPVYSADILNKLKYLTTSAPFSAKHIKEIENYLSVDLFLPHQRTAGNLDTYLGAEVLVDGEFAVQVANVLTHWPRISMTEDSYSEVAPYSGISHAVVVDDNAAAGEYIYQLVTLTANTPYLFSIYARTDSGTTNAYLTRFLNFTDALYETGNEYGSQTVGLGINYLKKIQSMKTGSDVTGWVNSQLSNTGVLYLDLASLRPIVWATFPNYTIGSKGGATGDEFGSYGMARSDGGIDIYKGPLAGAAGTNDITYTRTHTTVIGQVYTVVYTAYSDGTGTGKVTFGTEVSAIANTVTSPTTVSFQFTATDVTTNLVLESETPNGKITFKGVSVR